MNSESNVVFCIADRTKVESYVKIVAKHALEHNIQVETQTFEDFDKLAFGISEREYQIDLLFVDAFVNGESGALMVENLRKKNFNGVVIFLTSVKDQWEKAFDIQAFHYVIQESCPKKRFLWILTKAFERIAQRKQEIIAFTCAGERVIVPVKDLQYFEVMKERWITVHYQKECFEFFARIGKIEQTMLGKGFVRVHRSYLVAMHYVASIRFDHLTLLDGTEIPIGRGRYPDVKERFESMKRGERM